MHHIDETTGVTTRTVELDGEKIAEASTTERMFVTGLQALDVTTFNGQPVAPGTCLVVVTCTGTRQLAFVCPHEQAPQLHQPVEMTLRWTP